MAVQMRVYGSVRASPSKFNVVETTGRAQRGDIRWAVAEWLDHARSLPEFGSTDESAAGSSLGTSSDGGCFRSAGVSPS